MKRREPNRTEPKPHLELTYQSQNVPKTHTQKERSEGGAKGIYIDTRQSIAAGSCRSRWRGSAGWPGD